MPLSEAYRDASPRAAGVAGREEFQNLPRNTCAVDRNGLIKHPDLTYFTPPCSPRSLQIYTTADTAAVAGKVCNRECRLLNAGLCLPPKDDQISGVTAFLELTGADAVEPQPALQAALAKVSFAFCRGSCSRGHSARGCFFAAGCRRNTRLLSIPPKPF